MDLGAKLRGTLSLLIGGLLKKLNVFEQHCTASPQSSLVRFPTHFQINI